MEDGERVVAGAAVEEGLLCDDTTHDHQPPGKISWALFLLTTCWGMASWIGVNGLWVELPVLVNSLPEGWNTPSYWTVIISLGNIIPLSIIIHNHMSGARHEHHHRRKWEVPLIYVVLLCQLVACILLIFVWDKICLSHSLPLMFLLFVISVADCSSSLFFLPFLSHFPSEAISAYYTGGGLSGLLPGLIALAQGVGGDPECVPTLQPDGTTIPTASYPPPRFGAPYFFLTLTLMTVVSIISFVLLHTLLLPHADRHRHVVNHFPKPPPQDMCPVILESDESSGSSDVDGSEEEDTARRRMLMSPLAPTRRSSCTTTASTSSHSTSSPLSTKYLTYLMCIAFIVNLLGNGVLPSIQSYSCLPYGSATYHLAVSLSSAVNCFASILVVYSGKVWLGPLTGIDLALSAYILTLAVLSPNPPLVTSPVGSALVILAWIAHSGLFTFIKVSVAASVGAGGYKGLLCLGLVTQIASTSGSLLVFPLVNIYHFFETSTFTCPAT